MKLKNIKTFEEYSSELDNDFSQKFFDIFTNYLKTKNIHITPLEINENLSLFINDKYIGTVRFYIDSEWVIIDNIEINENLRGTGIGFHIYESLYKTAKNMKLKGFSSSLYSAEISQKRSKFATKVLDKLIHKYGGEKLDVSNWINDEDKDDGDIFDYFIDGRNSIEIRKV